MMWVHKFLIAALTLSLSLFATFAAGTAGAQEVSWPQEISGDQGTLVIYQPQPESLKGDKLSARAAISIELPDTDEPIFGAMWFESRIATDLDAGTVDVLDIKVTKAAWPDSKDAGEQRLMQFVEGAFPEYGLSLSYERLSASLETADIERKSLEALKSDPPIILFSEELAVLLMYDGEPRFEPVEDSPYERALNTPFLVAKEKSGSLFLSDGSHWYTAKDPLGPWALTTKPPADLAKAVAEGAAMDTTEGAGRAPAIVAATKPTELVVTDGKPDWQSLTGGEILYVQNTETPWLRDLPTGNMYILLSGRWYRSKSSEGPWTFVPANELPPAFAEIPPDSDIGGLRSSVAGTDEAEQAMLDAAIPQTAAIVRSEAELTVEYDGSPKFEKIEGTSVAYAVNTGAQVLRIDDRYYAVDDGVWFAAATPTGPWTVADTVPESEIAKIPPSSPVYNVTHVHVYESTPEVVYVGYTPGYIWSFPYYGVPVYGTGWYYPPYWGRYYYPRPPTWGLHVGYNPWTGWNFGMSWSNGFMTIGMSWGGGWGGAYRPWGCCGGWYGGGYRGPTIINTGDINIGNNINIGNRTEISNRIGDNNLSLGDRGGNKNLYQRPENRDRVASKRQRDQLKQARPATQRANNVFADRDGNVARRVDNGWETRDKGQWNRQSSASGASNKAENLGNRASTLPSTSRDLSTQRNSNRSSSFNRSQMDRAHRARNMGGSRERARRGRRR
ncbi:carbohydrate-binding family V/XII [Congregibacter brevis]|uniref:Carbohydrate-binding family V/XII n=1 Tax=Congregibacter brevis TaxID=3081201 RepID=A0ABZ0IDK3_9GAMM|nr:carbohydrate-binding family V/XII [Congregibacter sp. IMCC45268]